MEVSSTLPLPILSEEEMAVGYPKEDFPSDHFILGATFKITLKK
jgi:mRNA deadenylase 3'-5' endonuclease subunit Ccr4